MPSGSSTWHAALPMIHQAVVKGRNDARAGKWAPIKDEALDLGGSGETKSLPKFRDLAAELSHAERMDARIGIGRVADVVVVHEQQSRLFCSWSSRGQLRRHR